MSETYYRRLETLQRSVGIAHDTLGRLKKALDKDYRLPRGAFKEKHDSFIASLLLIDLPVQLAEVIVDLKRFRTTMYTGKRGW